MKHRIELFLADAKQIHSAPYGSGVNASEFEEKETDEILWEEVIEPARTQWTALVVLARKDDSQLLLSQLPETRRCYKAGRVPETTHGQMYQLARQRCSLLNVLMRRAGTGRSRSQTKIETRRS